MCAHLSLDILGTLAARVYFQNCIMYNWTCN